MDSSLSDHTAALSHGERKHHPEIWKLSFLFLFLNELASLTAEFLLWRQRYWGPSLTDVLWHELSSADVRTAEGFDSVHFRYPLSKRSWSEQTPLPAPPGELHIGLLPASESGDCCWMLTLNMATACNVLLNSKICHFGRVCSIRGLRLCYLAWLINCWMVISRYRVCILLWAIKEIWFLKDNFQVHSCPAESPERQLLGRQFQSLPARFPLGQVWMPGL